MVCFSLKISSSPLPLRWIPSLRSTGWTMFRSLTTSPWSWRPLMATPEAMPSSVMRSTSKSCWKIALSCRWRRAPQIECRTFGSCFLSPLFPKPRSYCTMEVGGKPPSQETSPAVPPGATVSWLNLHRRETV